MVMKLLESEIQNAVCQYLELKHYFFWRQNTAPTVTKENGQMRFRRLSKYSVRGVPDIILIKNGKFVGLEVKRDGTYQSSYQKEFEKRCVEHGAEYHVVRSVDDVVSVGL